MEFNQEFFATFGFTVVNIVVLYIILKKILFNPVSKHMEARSEKIQEAIESAEENKKMIEEMKAEYDQKLKDAGEEGKKIVNEYLSRANKEYEDVIAKAREDAKQVINEARLEIELEKKQMFEELKSEIAGLVMAASEKVIRKNVDTDANRKIVAEFINDDSVAS